MVARFLPIAIHAALRIVMFAVARHTQQEKIFQSVMLFVFVIMRIFVWQALTWLENF